MKYIVDIHNTSNTASLQNFLQSKIDLSNNFFPGINRYVGSKVGTYYKKAPYMLAANTAWLVPNTTKKPLDDPEFRRALAESININRIVTADYGNIVSKASPTGLLPTWSKWVDQAQVSKLGFTYSISKAKSRLASAGYRDRNGDGFVENKDGSSIDLRLSSRKAGTTGRPRSRSSPTARRTPASRSHLRIPTSTAWSRSATRASSTRDQQREADRQHAVHVLRLPLPPAALGTADGSQLLALQLQPEPGRCRSS